MNIYEIAVTTIDGQAETLDSPAISSRAHSLWVG